jgi:propanol-preferring alcohol dehydrogenase
VPPDTATRDTATGPAGNGRACEPSSTLGVNQVSQNEVKEPDVALGHVLLKVAAAGVCQTDIHMRSSPVQMIPAGVVLGHEIAGNVVETAPDVEHLEAGELVAVHPVWSCGVCRQCVAGRENACLNTRREHVMIHLAILVW